MGFDTWEVVFHVCMCACVLLCYCAIVLGPLLLIRTSTRLWKGRRGRSEDMSFAP